MDNYASQRTKIFVWEIKLNINNKIIINNSIINLMNDYTY